MLEFITAFRQTRLRNEVIRVGEQLREYQAVRKSVTADEDPQLATDLDIQIDVLTRKRDRALTKFKESNTDVQT